MQQNLINFEKLKISWQVGSAEQMEKVQNAALFQPFSEEVLTFLNEVSKRLLKDREAKQYPDVVTLAFWMRKASLEELRKRFIKEDGDESLYQVGRGIVFHIAPSNVPVNYAYSLVTGLLCGNINIVRIPSKDFPQITIINRAIQTVLTENPAMQPYITLVQYGHDRAINDAFSAICDARVIWGGDATIKELRKSPMQARATEVTFADRYSLAVIDAETYLSMDNKAAIANDFYNDTYLTDQNACTSPRVVAWTGKNINEAKELFWSELYKLVETKYELSGVQAVNKLASGYLLAIVQPGAKKTVTEDNLIVRMQVKELTADLMEIKDNSGYFFEYDCQDILELKEICNDTRCQTVSYLGNKKMLIPLIQSGVKGIDRVVPMGKTMDFDLIWDGYALLERLTRYIAIQ